MEVEKLARVWPEWKVEKELGRGSYGVVYKVVRKDDHIESHAAVKVISIPSNESEINSLRSEGLSEEGAKTYFQGIVNDFVGEIRLMESMKGVQNIVSVEDYKVVENTEGIGWDIFIRMELLTPFNDYTCDKKLTEKDVIKLGVDICTALEICGQRDIVHRDIKPENIFINDFGYYKLGDFGIARKLENATGGLSQKGTFNYMAPEVATGTSYDARVDIYSLGIVLYRLLNGNRLPFIENEKQLQNPNERKKAVERRIRGEKMPFPCEASAQVAAVIMKACAYNPQARFKNATEMKDALTRASMGAYTAMDEDLDKTVSVRQAAQDVNATVRVNRAPNNYNGAAGQNYSQNYSNNTANRSGAYNGNNTGNRSGAYNGNNTGNRSGAFNGNNTVNRSGAFNGNNTGNRSGAFNGNNTVNRSGSFTGNQSGAYNTMNRTGGVMTAQKSGFSVLGVVSLVACFVTMMVFLILGEQGSDDEKLVFNGVILFVNLILLFLPGFAMSLAAKHQQKGKIFAIVAVVFACVLNWGVADAYFSAYNKVYLGDSTVAAALNVVYGVAFTIASLLTLLRNMKKSS